MEFTARVSGDYYTVESGRFRVSYGQRGFMYAEDRGERGGRYVPHASLHFCIEEVSRRSGVPADEVRSGIEAALRAARDKDNKCKDSSRKTSKKGKKGSRPSARRSKT